MEHYTIVADPRVKDDLKEAKEYLNKKRRVRQKIPKGIQENINLFAEKPVISNSV
ncbi:hypothetical protein [Flavobacterium sp.]|jgi:hypothetical protein|uniref:hypothetical protein n=1 Tax=Flavobacterium sp. TaxID=239 RepID=UPI0037BF47AB